MHSARLEQVISDISGYAAATFTELVKQWKELYVVDEKLLDHRLDQFLKFSKWFYDDMIQSQKLKKKELLEELDLKLREKAVLEEHLFVSIPCDYLKDEPLTKVLEMIEASLQKYREIREKRINQLEELKNKEKLLCVELTMEPLNLVCSEIPSLHDLECYEERIFAMEEEKIERADKFIKTRERMQYITDKLEVGKLTALERDIINGSPETFALTSENMDRINNALDILERDLKIAQEKADRFIETLNRLWDRIKEDEGHKSEFLKSHTGLGKTTLNKLVEEIERCEEIKRANIKPLIESTRKEMAELWDIMTYTEEQRRESCPSFFIDLNTEDILELHELELTRLQIFYKENEKLFELAKKRDHLWQRMLHLDEVAQNKNRLFDNRGGQLLKEEKERKLLETNVPKITKQLETGLIEFEEKYQKQFLYNGSYLLEKMKDDWEERVNKKESKKLARKLENAKTLEAESKLGTRAPQKRKLPGTPKSGYLTRTPVKTPRYERSRPTTPSNVSLASVASYSYFQEQVEEKSRMFTTPKSCRALKCVNTQAPIVTHSSPNMTPVKKVIKTPKSMTDDRRRVLRTPKSASALTGRPVRKLKTPGGAISSPSPFRGRQALFSAAFTPVTNKSPLHI